MVVNYSNVVPPSTTSTTHEQSPALGGKAVSSAQACSTALAVMQPPEVAARHELQHKQHAVLNANTLEAYKRQVWQATRFSKPNDTLTLSKAVPEPKSWGTPQAGYGGSRQGQNTANPSSSMAFGLCLEWGKAQQLELPQGQEDIGRKWPKKFTCDREARKWRRDLPTGQKTGGKRPRADISADSVAVNELVLGTHTATSRKSIGGRLRWWESKAKERGFAPYPVDEEKLTLAAALLKRGKYKSASQYLYTIKKQRVKLGFAWYGNWKTLMSNLRWS